MCSTTDSKQAEVSGATPPPWEPGNSASKDTLSSQAAFVTLANCPPPFFLNFVFYIGVSLINNVVLVSGVQQSDSVIHTHVSILFQILFPFRLLQNIERSSLC